MGLAASPEQLLAGEEDDDVCSGSVRFSGDPVELIEVDLLPFATAAAKEGCGPASPAATAATAATAAKEKAAHEQAQPEKRVTISPGAVQGARECGPSPSKRRKRPHDSAPRRDAT